MNDLPPPTAEGELIRQARDLAIPRLSIRAAATRVGMSPEQWGNIERGYRYTKPGDPPRPFRRPPAVTIAKMASAVGLTPERLETEGQRPDAAETLREMLRQRGTSHSTPSLHPADDLELALYIQGVHEDLGRAMAQYGPCFTPEQAFSLPHEAATWADEDGDLPGPSARVRLIARIRKMTDEFIRDQESQSKTDA